MFVGKNFRKSQRQASEFPFVSRRELFRRNAQWLLYMNVNAEREALEVYLGDKDCVLYAVINVVLYYKLSPSRSAHSKAQVTDSRHDYVALVTEEE